MNSLGVKTAASSLSFAERLERVKAAALMTTADLSNWFARPYPTVRGWLYGYDPWGPNGQEAMRLLLLLEAAVKKRKGFPIPIDLSPAARRSHVKKMRHELDPRVPKTRTA